jgi:hypothetical protein
MADEYWLELSIHNCLNRSAEAVRASGEENDRVWIMSHAKLIHTELQLSRSGMGGCESEMPRLA